MAYPRSVRSRSYKTAKRTAGNVTVGAAAFNVDTALDMTIPAQVGDTLRYAISSRFNASTGSDATVDVGTLVSAAIVNYFGGGMTVGAGWQGWYCANTTTSQPLTGPAWYTVVAGDLSSGLVTVRLRAIGGGSGAVTINATATSFLAVMVENLGPVSPH